MKYKKVPSVYCAFTFGPIWIMEWKVSLVHISFQPRYGICDKLLLRWSVTSLSLLKYSDAPAHLGLLLLAVTSPPHLEHCYSKWWEMHIWLLSVAKVRKSIWYALAPYPQLASPMSCFCIKSCPHLHFKIASYFHFFLKSNQIKLWCAHIQPRREAFLQPREIGGYGKWSPSNFHFQSCLLQNFQSCQILQNFVP